MTNRHGTCADRHSLVRNQIGSPGHYMSHLRTCTHCGLKKPQQGGTTNRGSHFRCAQCKAKGSIPK